MYRNLTKLIIILLPLAATAEEIHIAQKGKAFLINGENVTGTQINAKVGDTIKFSNDDEVDHNIFVHVTSNNEFIDYGLQASKATDTITHTFSKPGSLEFGCAIHPYMTVTVMVE